MRPSPRSVLPWLAAALVTAGSAWAAEVDPSQLYDVSTGGSSTQVKAGDKGTLVLALHTKGGAHISDEAPIKITLAGKNLTLAKTALTRSDAKPGTQNPNGPADPRFEVPFTAGAAGKGEVQAKLTFFVCTEQLCSRQQKSLTLPVDVK